MRLGERDIEFVLKRSPDRRRAALTVDDRGLTVNVPWRTSERYIQRFLQDSSKWILRKLEQWEKNRPAARQWESGELIDFLGRQLTLHITEEPYALTQLADDDVLKLSLPTPHDAKTVRNAVVRWYRRHAQAHFRARVEHFAQRLGVPAPRVFISSAQTRWGSCNANNEVRLNWRLMQGGAHVVDYVVAHELAHLKEMNHSARFWRVVERLFPDYESAKAELNAMGTHFMAL